jgi:integrase
VIGRFWQQLIGCGLRRPELVRLETEDFQVREEHWVIVARTENVLREKPGPSSFNVSTAFVICNICN